MPARTFNLADLFEVVATAVPQRTALACGDQRLSFAELDRRATQLAAGLRQRGIGRGQRVGLQLYNSAAYVESFLACCKIGAAPVNVNYRYSADELAYLFGSLDLDGLVFGADFSATVAAVAPRVPTLKRLLQVGGTPVAGAEDYEAALAGDAGSFSDPGRSDDDLYLLCTGGTTGLPKGVMWPHRSLFMGALGGGGIYFGRPPIQRPEELADLVPLAPGLVYLALAPMMHGAAMWASLISLLAGHTVVVNPHLGFDAAQVWGLVQTHRVNILSVVGDAMALPLIQALEAEPSRWDLSSLKIFGNGGAVFSPHLQDRLRALQPQLAINNGMGSSETGLLGGRPKPGRGDGLIRLEPRADLALVDDALNLVSGPGAEGTLARTGHTPIGYYGDAKKTAETFVTIDGRLWVLTGDRARIDPDGDIVVLGRGSLCINTGGEKVFPEEVETAARRYPAVRDVLVVGLPDERWGQKVAAVVQVEPGQTFDAQAFDRTCRETLAGYKVPKAVFIAPQVQRSPAGKADYRWALSFASAQAAPG